MKKDDALLEIRIENIPARFVISAEKQLLKFAEEELKKERIIFDGLEVFGTYKRLVLFIKGIEGKTAREKFWRRALRSKCSRTPTAILQNKARVSPNPKE